MLKNYRIITAYSLGNEQRNVNWAIHYKESFKKHYIFADLQMDVLKYFESRGDKLSSFNYKNGL